MFFTFGKTPKRQSLFWACGERIWNGSWERHFQAQTKVPHCKNLMVTGTKGQIKFFLVCMHEGHRTKEEVGSEVREERRRRKRRRRRRKEGEMYLFCNSIISLLTWQITPFFRKFQKEPEGLHRAGHAYILI